ncbi:sulfatase-like hydrolase/transferase [Rasiella rasia]|uniref:Sulfatase-like hydrolase/transferase n=1 Tax=Rasiella rasia TaxID=2744027 RepID=A0A6G6GKL3_9FLAO|nr:sulfatase-like hydrolase/transferase [Rasiella rasia]QIE59088.1 sulfatase-like hydrolase/transferase [Rasiella rasia]
MKSEKKYSLKLCILAAIAPGLYPIFFYYSKNFPLVNSWEHLAFFIIAFLAIPVVVFLVSNWLFGLLPFKSYHKYLLPFLNVFTLLYLLKVCYFIGIEKDKILIAAVIAAIVSFFLHKHLLKIIFFEFLLALIGLVSMGSTMVQFLSISDDWRTQPDGIANVQFKNTPNVYVIQADGYANFAELKKGYYNYPENTLERYLKAENFTLYPEYRSNYSTTVESNVTLFNMKHHYYNKSIGYNEIFNGRNMIVSENVVLDAFKHNGYKTYFLTETPYLIANRPKMGFHTTNFPYSDLKYIRNGARRIKDVEEPLKQFIAEETQQPKFFFVQILNPWHVSSVNHVSRKKENEREQYLERLEETNTALIKTIKEIRSKDLNAVVILMSDHGGFVGMNHTGEKRTKNIDRDFQYSIFGANLAISWPNDSPPSYDSQLKSSVNLFRVLFSYLSEDNRYLEHLQENGSYLIIKNKAEPGIYQTIDDTGNVVFKPLDSLSF